MFWLLVSYTKFRHWRKPHNHTNTPAMLLLSILFWFLYFHCKKEQKKIVFFKKLKADWVKYWHDIFSLIIIICDSMNVLIEIICVSWSLSTQHALHFHVQSNFLEKRNAWLRHDVLMHSLFEEKLNLYWK